MKLTFRTFKTLVDFIPEPTLAKTKLPDWIREMPSEAHSQLLGMDVRTVKQCPPVLDAMMYGALLPLAADIHVEDGRFSWDWDRPPIEQSRLTSSPIGFHVPEQLSGSNIDYPEHHFAVKFNNFWSIEAPKGWSVLFTHPFNRMDLPFRSLTGLVDCDRFKSGFVHVPALWTDPDFNGVLAAGTPIAQLILVPRELLSLEISSFDEDAFEQHSKTLDMLDEEVGAYRKYFRAPRS